MPRRFAKRSRESGLRRGTSRRANRSAATGSRTARRRRHGRRVPGDGHQAQPSGGDQGAAGDLRGSGSAAALSARSAVGVLAEPPAHRHGLRRGEYQERQYLITEYVDGGTLRQWAGTAAGLAADRRAPDRGGRRDRDRARGGDPAPRHQAREHSAGKNGYAKLADFGIAKLLEADPLADDAFGAQSRGDQSSLVGTAAYMSPEQTQGRRSMRAATCTRSAWFCTSRSPAAAHSPRTATQARRCDRSRAATRSERRHTPVVAQDGGKGD